MNLEVFMRKKLFLILLALVLFIPVFSLAQEEMPTEELPQEDLHNPEGPSAPQNPKTDYFRGKVVDIQSEENQAAAIGGNFIKVIIELTNGERKGERVEVLWTNDPTRPGSLIVENEDKLIVGAVKTSETETWSIVDRDRGNFLLALLALFLFVTVFVSGKQGAKAVGVMSITFIVILYFLVPQIIKGADPLVIAIISISIFFAPALLLSHGVNKKTYAAIIGIIISTVIIGILALLSVRLSRVTGATEETIFLGAATGGQNIDLLKIFLAGILFGSLGVIDDLAITQASIVKEIKTARPDIKVKELFLRAMNVGKDHISAAINTLFLAYTGAALPLIILLAQLDTPIWVAVQREFITTEIVRTLVSTIGLILAVPIATTAAAYIIDRKK